MQRVMRWNVLLPACLAAVMLAGAARAQDDKPAGGPLDRKALDGMVYTNLKDVINHGANLYNSGDWNGCYRLWEGALMGLKPLLGHRPELQKTIDTAISNAQQDPMLYRRAFVLRTALDEIRNDLKGNAPKKDKDTTAGDTPKTPDKVKTDVPPKTPDKVKTTEAPKKLWDRLGGETGVSRIVDDFVNAAAADPKVDFFRGGKRKLDAAGVAKMKREFVEWISDKTGGPLRYEGPDMKKVHQGMGISNEQYDAVVGHIKNALQKNRVSEQDTATILAAVNSYRKEIVAPAKTEEKKTEEKKPIEKKTEDKKNGDKKTEEKKPVEKKTEDKKPVGTPPADKRPEDKKPADKKTDEKKAEATGSVTGHVTYKGKPVPNGNVVFVAADGGKVKSALKADGTYEVARIKAGEYKVAIEQTAKLGAGGDKAPAGAGNKAPADAKVVVIPAKYGDPKTSGLTIILREGAQIHDIDLQ